MAYELRSARFLASEIRHACVRHGDTVVDATLGNGHDALELAELVGAEGHVIGLDIQKEAVEKSTQRLCDAGMMERCSFHICGHEHLAEMVHEPVRYICFNLGWLPGGNKEVTTRWETTQKALQQALALLQPQGVMTVCVYPGHAEGAHELEEIQAFLQTLRPQDFNCLRQTFLNAGPGSPECYVVQRQ